MLMREAIDIYEARHLPRKNPATAQYQSAQFREWKDLLGDMPIDEVRVSTLVAAAAAIKDKETNRGTKRKGQTVNSFLATLSCVFRTAIQEDWGVVDINPVSSCPRYPKSKRRLRTLTNAEFEKLLAAARATGCKMLEPFLIVSMGTACRQSELLRLEWPQVDFNNNEIVILESKNGEFRCVPMLTTVRDTLWEMRKATGSVFGLKRFPRKQFNEALEASGLNDGIHPDSRNKALPHSMRHTCLSMLGRKGASALQIMEISGHKDPKMAAWYTKFDRKSRHGIMALIEGDCA